MEDDGKNIFIGIYKKETHQINSMSIHPQKTMSKQNIHGSIRKHENNSEDMNFCLRNRKERTSSPSIFISKAFEILENHQYDDIIRWNSDGTTFIIDDIDKFQSIVLPVYFRHRNYSSFVRQLNMYDFHKIRNEANRNIFEHKEFRMHCRDGLKKIKRKGCNGKRLGNQNQYPEKQDISEPEQIKSHKTVVNSRALVENSDTYIPKMSPFGNSYENYHSRNKFSSSSRISPTSNSPYRRKLVEQFLNSLPETVNDQLEIETLLKEMKKNEKYECLHSKEEMKKIVKKIKKLKLPKPSENDLDDLSIEEQILVDKINGTTIRNPSLAIFSTQKCIPMRSMSLIGSLNFVEDVENFIYPH